MSQYLGCFYARGRVCAELEVEFWASGGQPRVLLVCRGSTAVLVVALMPRCCVAAIACAHLQPCEPLPAQRIKLQRPRLTLNEVCCTLSVRTCMHSARTFQILTRALGGYVRQRSTGGSQGAAAGG